MRGEVVEPASDGGEERGGVGIGVSGDERVEVAVTRGGADDVECPPLGIATAWGGGCMVSCGGGGVVGRNCYRSRDGRQGRHA